MYIEPNTTVRILKNCPLDTTYDHTLYFLNKSQQVNYFSSLSKYTLKAYSYQRVNSNTIRVEVKADNLYDCNYIMFQNSNFGDKWFYAFIKSVEYINNITSAIEYEIDVMQTWHFDYQLGQCFVEREHTVTDNPGDNIVAENLETGEYMIDTATTDVVSTGSLRWVVLTTFTTYTDEYGGTNYRDYSGGEWGGLFSGLYRNVFDSSAEARAFIANTAAIKQSGIIALCTMPADFVTSEGSPAITKAVTVRNGWYSSANAKLPFVSYVPRNNKLYTHPYNFMYVTNQQGNTAVYPYEYFSFVNGNCLFEMSGDFTQSPTVLLVPGNYKGSPRNVDEAITLRGWPMLEWNTDSFKAYIAQMASSGPLSALTSAVGHAGQINTANAMLNRAAGTSSKYLAAGATLGYVGAGLAVADSVARVAAHAAQPPQSHSGSGSTLYAALKRMYFIAYRKHITEQYARIIDDYFTMYGYAVHECKVPNRNARPHWTYTKTIGCVVHGSVPCDDMHKICDIYNNGITFWNNGNEVGNYSLDNSPG